MLSSVIAYAVSLGISFLLSPYIVKNIGIDAYGFIGLANNFVSYAMIITIALNSLAGRFVTIKIYEKDIDGANKYFSSVFYADGFIAILLGIISVLFIVFIERIIEIPIDILTDVKLLFVILFANCIIGIIGTVFNIATFATNKLYLNSLRNIESNVIRAVLTVLLFVFLKPRLSYISIAVFVAGVYVLLMNIYYTNKLTPYLRISRKSFDIKAVKELIFSGLWNTVSRLGQLLQEGLDLLITNIFINPVAMGVLSLAKTIPTAITGLVGTLVGVFSPNFTILYAEGKREELIKTVKQSIKIMSVICNLPIIILIVCGPLFFSLWQPTQNAEQLHILSILTCFGLVFNGGINCFYNIFTIVNKIKYNSIAICITGILNVFVVYLLLKLTNLGIYAVAGVSTAIATLRNLLFTVPYGARCLEQKWYIFYLDVIKPLVFVSVCSVVGIFIGNLIGFFTWIGLVVYASITLLISIFLGLFVLLNKDDRSLIYSKIKRRK